MKTMAEEYAKLREQKRSKVPGIFVNDLDGANGRLSKLMFELGERLGAPGHTQEEVIRIMGAPDAIIHGNKEHDEYKESHDPQAKDVPGNSTRLVYLFRGWAAYLYFVCVDGKVLRASWYLAMLR